MSKWWNIQETASHNCLFNFIDGIRGAGKTYGMLKYLTERHIAKGYNFLYLRRTEEELKKLTTQKNGRLFNHVQVEFPGHALWAESDILHIDKEVMGYAQALSTAKKLKSDAMVNVRDIVFDEYKVDPFGTSRELRDEVTAFFELYESVARPGAFDYDVRVWFLGNALTTTDCYTSYFNIPMPYNTDIWKRGDVLKQLVAPQELIDAKKDTRFYKLIEGSEYASYAAENTYLRDKDSFIGKKGKNSEYQFTMIYKDSEIGVWIDYRNGRYYISDSVDKQCRLVYATTDEEHKPNTLLLKGFKSSTHLKNLKSAYDKGCVYYENQKLANWFRDIIRMGL